MRLATLRRARTEPPLPGVHGVARVDTEVARLAERARPGDIAVLDRLDIDAGSARLLVAAGVGAVVNAAASTSGRYPNLGPRVLMDASVPVLDRVGPEVMRLLGDGDRLRLDGDTLYRGNVPVASGERLSDESVHQQMERARSGLTHQLKAFAANTVEHLRTEHDLLLDGEGVPQVDTVIAGRPVVVVSAGHGWREDLDRLRAWIRHNDPVLVGVDQGADALLSVGLRPDLVVGDPTLVVEDALTCGAEVVVRGNRGGDPAAAAGHALADQHGSRAVVFTVTGSSLDAALLLVHAHEAALIVGVGTQVELADFVDRGRADMAGTFLTRLTVGTRLVDASTVASIYRRPTPAWPLWLLAVALVAGVVATAVLAGDATTVGEWRQDLVDWMDGVSSLVGLPGDTGDSAGGGA
ncbi:MAG TPA: putative cytokinetic ring protein SteA [Actinomycetes bacterium]